jgi:Domain of unknown function (DUF4062)
MPDQLRVFISSTYSGLKEYRQATIRTLRRFGLVPATLETFGAMQDAPVDASARAIAEADIVVCILAHRLGYIPPDSDESLLELEYDEAIKRKNPVLVFVLRDNQPWPPDQIDFANQDRLQKFKRRLSIDRIVGTFSTSTLQQIVAASRGDQKSYSEKGGSISQPAEFLGVPSRSVGPLSCFVIMPYSERWSDAIQRTILEVSQKVGFEFTIAKNMEGRFIPNDIWRGITGAGLIIADL